jgi:hypothetical protein
MEVGIMEFGDMEIGALQCSAEYRRAAKAVLIW